MRDGEPSLSKIESVVEQKVREAQERGDFDDLPGAGEPIPDIDRPYEDTWWIKRKMRRENLSYLPAALQLRKDAEEATSRALAARSDDEARAIVDEVNVRIGEALRKPPAGPPVTQQPLDVHEILTQRREAR
ncbi:MAG: DUF1992 domain-containing protein [Streptosporangiales bacterium]|nr:DUF1992 domain-containing protein [Streptosporangiales bacterium]